MKITCPICKGAGWCDKNLQSEGKPPCEPCGGVGTINIAALQDRNKDLEVKLDRIYEEVCSAVFHLGESIGYLYIKDEVWAALRKVMLDCNE